MRRPSIVPEPQALECEPGEFLLRPETEIYFDPVFADVAELLAGMLRPATGYSFPLTAVTFEEKGQPGFTGEHLERGHICLTLDGELAQEEYRLAARPWGIRLQSSKPQGMIHAAHTLLQLLPPAIFSRGPRIGVVWATPCTHIQDKPRFAWRGALLDCARHFLPIPELKRFIEAFALHHFNILQLHLSDDQGWRIEIKALPRLTEIGAFRSGTRAGHQMAPGVDEIAHGGFYTQEELRELIDFAARRGIMLVPEIDLPGHATALLASYPQLASGRPPAEPAYEFGILPHSLFPSPENLAFLAPVFEETLALFPGSYFHIGGDEVLVDRWNADSRTPALLRDYGLSSVRELQPWFTRYLHGIAARYGKQIVGWDEILDDDLPEDVIAMYWRSRVSPPEGNRHRLVLARHTHTYFDTYHSMDMASEPLAIGGCIPLEKVYHYEPLDGLSESAASAVQGVQGQLWTEYLRSPHSRQTRAFPRYCALAEVAWSLPEVREWSDFQSRLNSHLCRLDVMEMAYWSL